MNYTQKLSQLCSSILTECSLLLLLLLLMNSFILYKSSLHYNTIVIIAPKLLHIMLKHDSPMRIKYSAYGISVMCH